MAKVTRFGEAEYQEMPDLGSIGDTQGAAPSPMTSAPRPQQLDPHDIINNQFGQFKDQYRAEYRKLQHFHGTDTRSFNHDVTKLNADANRFEAQMADQMAILDRIAGYGAAGHMTPEQVYELSMRSVVPRQEADVLFPKPETMPSPPTPSAVGLSPTQQTSSIRIYTDIMRASVVNPWGWGATQRKRSDPAILEEMFLDQWDMQNLDDPRNGAKRIGFIKSWKAAAADNGYTKKTWGVLSNTKTGSVEVRRRLMSAGPIKNWVTEKFGSVSPAAKSIGKNIKAWAPPSQPPQPPEDFSTMSDEELIRIAGGM